MGNGKQQQLDKEPQSTCVPWERRLGSAHEVRTSSLLGCWLNVRESRDEWWEKEVRMVDLDLFYQVFLFLPLLADLHPGSGCFVQLRFQEGE